MTQPPQWGDQWGRQPGPQGDPYQQQPYQQQPYQQQPYQQNPYQQPFPYAPPPPPRGNRNVVIALSAALVVVIVAAVVTILLVNKDSSPNVGGGGGGGLPAPTSAAPYPSGALPSATGGGLPSETGDGLPSEQSSPSTEPQQTTEDSTTDRPSTDAPTGDTGDAGDAQAVVAADQAFWDAVKAADYDKADALTCSGDRGELASSIKEYLNGRESQLEVTVGTATITGSDTAQVEQTLKFPGEKDDSASIDMKKESGAWLVCTS